MSNKQTQKAKYPKLSAIRRADPELEREMTKYDYPLPSREYILQILAEQGVPVSFERL